MAKTRGMGVPMRWCDTAYIPRYLEVPGVLGARRFVAIDGPPKYLTVYDFAGAEVPERAAWSTARDSNPWAFRIRPHLTLDPGSPGVCRRIYPTQAAAGPGGRPLAGLRRPRGRTYNERGCRGCARLSSASLP